MDVSFVDLEAGLTRNEAADLARVSPHAVNMWGSRGWVEPDGTRRTLTVVGMRDGQRLFRQGDVLAAERATRKNPRGAPRHPRPVAA